MTKRPEGADGREEAAVEEQETRAEPTPRPGTTCVHGGAPPPREGDPVVPPIVQSATFYGGRGGGAELRYTRYGNNPTQRLVAEKVAALEGMEATLPTASGMAAMALTVLALAEEGGHVAASRYLYGATVALLRDELPRRGIVTTFVDPDDPHAWREAVEPSTRLFLFELPTNPTLRVFDPRPIVEVARDVGVSTVVDATFASPVNFRPAEVGIDVSIHSATKYLGGHSDLVAGVASGSRDFVERATGLLRMYGPALDPHAAWLLDRGLRTLELRVRRQNGSALALARALEAHPAVEAVLHPGLPSHPDHAVASELLSGTGGMVSLVVRGGGEAADRLCDRLEVARVAPSLGGVETLVSQPRFTSHAGWSARERAATGIPDGFVRVSVGVEDPADLRDDFGRALDALGDR